MGVTKRCPFTGRSMKTHGMEASPTYSIWKGMVERCTSPTSTAFTQYGGRGIGVCERWRSFENFLADMGPRPTGLTLDRKDGSLGYSPENCRWATWREQQNNRKSNVYVEVDGERMTLSNAARHIGVAPGTLMARIRNGVKPPRLFQRVLQPGHAPRRPT